MSGSLEVKSGTPSEEEPAAKATVADPKGGLARGRSARFNVYLDKLDSMSLPLYARRKYAEDVAAVIGTIGVVLMLAANEMTAEAAEADAEAADELRQSSAPGNGTASLRYEDTASVTWIKAASSFTTLILLITIILRYRVDTQIMKMRNIIPPNVSMWTTGRVLPWMLLELCICAWHIPPGVDTEFRMGGITSAFHVNETGTLMILRLYLWARVLRNHSGYYSRMVAFIGSLHNVETTGIFFTFKMLFREAGWKLLLPLILLCIIINTVCLRILERRSETSMVNNYYDASWVTVVTMSTVGYGDITPETLSGRVVTLLFAIAGGALLVTMITAVFIDFLTLSPSEAIVVSTLKQRETDRGLRQYATLLIQRAWKLLRLKRRIRSSSRGRALHLAKQFHHLSARVFDAMQTMRAMRRSRHSSDSDDDLRLARLEAKVDKLLALMAPEEAPVHRHGRRGPSSSPKGGSFHSLEAGHAWSEDTGSGLGGGGGAKGSRREAATRGQPLGTPRSHKALSSDAEPRGTGDVSGNGLRRASTMYTASGHGAGANDVDVEERSSSSEERSSDERRPRRHRRRGHGQDPSRRRRNASRHRRGGSGSTFIQRELIRPLEVNRHGRR